MLKTEKFTFNQFAENTYIIFDDENKNAIIIDPGCSNSQEENQLSNFIENKKLNVKYLINTHCHIDHILGNSFVKEKYNPKFLIGKEDEFLLELMHQQAAMFNFKVKKSPMADEYLSEDLILPEFKIKFLKTPGHSPGEFCLNLYEEKICITGDVLFKEGIGRTDLWGGNYNQLIESIETKLLILENEVVILSGHGEFTTIGYEKENNPFL